MTTHKIYSYFDMPYHASDYSEVEYLEPKGRWEEVPHCEWVGSPNLQENFDNSFGHPPNCQTTDI